MRGSPFQGGRISVTFIHSVNQYPLTDIYEIRDHRIYVVRTIYNNFGAGVQTEIEEGQKLEYGENGEMIVSGFDLGKCHGFLTSWGRFPTMSLRSMEKRSA